MKKLFPFLMVAMLLAPVVLAAVNQDVSIIRPLGPKMKRAIANTISEQDIEFFKDKGCVIRHRLKDATSIDCPENIISQLNVRESRVFRIMDLDADKQIGADKVWAEGVDGSGVKVAILDTGIDTDHPELQDSYLGGYDYVNNDAYPEDDHGHGTHVAGIITANGANDVSSKGVSPAAGIYMYKVCNANGECYEDDMMAAMEAAVATDAKVMSISIGGGSYTTENCDSDPLAAKVNWVVSQGLTVVVAAGNDGKGVSSPGCASGAIAVGAVDKSNNVPYWSGRGKALDIVAPGVNIYSTLIGGYGKMSGTSMATPHVSGVVALLLDANPNLTTSEIKTALYNTANPVNKCYKCTLWFGSTCFRQSEVTCTPEITGAGVVNAYGAYLAVKPQGPACSSDVDCNDGNQCTTDVCENPGTAEAYCSNTPVANGTSCDDGQFCTVDDVCTAGVCGGTARDCSDGIACTIDSCNEVSDVCVNTPDNSYCGDGLWCNGEEICDATLGCLAGTPVECGDGNECTTDSCNEVIDACEYTNVADNTPCTGGVCCSGTCELGVTECPTAVKCWSAEYQYLYKSSSQAKKFCKCAQGTYGYNSYSYTWGRKTVYQYIDSGDNENWEVTSKTSNLPVDKVTCKDGKEYSTKQDYYYQK
jgi:hypothetical protein